MSRLPPGVFEPVARGARSVTLGSVEDTTVEAVDSSEPVEHAKALVDSSLVVTGRLFFGVVLLFKVVGELDLAEAILAANART